MAGTIKFNGDNLLQLFKNLHIELGHLTPNNVRAWFDTDDQDKISLLNFMCSSLSEDNILTAQELEEFESIEKPLYGNELESSIQKCEEKHPGIFNLKLTSNQLKVAQVELRQLKKEEAKLDQLLNVNTSLQHNLLQQKSGVETDYAKLNFRLEELTENCRELAKDLDDKNNNLHEKITKDLSQLFNFQLNESDFFNRMNLEDIQDTEEFLTGVEDVVRQQHDDLSGNFTESKILNSTPNEEDSGDVLETMKNKIFHSYMEYFRAQIEVGVLSQQLDYLEKFFVKNFLSNCTIGSISEMNLQSKVGQKNAMLSCLEKKAMNLSEELINQVKVKGAKTELQNLEDKLVCFSQIAEYYTKVSCIISCALMFLLHEKKSIEECDRLIKNSSRYILHNLEDTKYRTDLMLSLIEKFNIFDETPLECRNQLIHSVVTMYDVDTLKGAFACFNSLEENIKTMQLKKLGDTLQVSEVIEQLFNNEAIKRFLQSGLTRQIVIIPSPIQKSLRNIHLNLEKQNSVIKSLLQTVNLSLKKLNSDTLFKNLRLVWIYFLVAPKKLEELMLRINEELKVKETTKAVRFKNV